MSMRNIISLVLSLPLTALAAEPAVKGTALGAAAASTTTPGLTTAAVTSGAASTGAVGTGAGSVAAQLGSLVLGLVLVLGLICLLAWVVKRMQRIGPASGQAIKLVASQALSTRDRLLLVQVGEEQILLGLTPGRISALHVLKEPVPVTTSESATPEFAQRLMELLGKDHKDKS